MLNKKPPRAAFFIGPEALPLLEALIAAEREQRAVEVQQDVDIELASAGW